MIKRFLLYVCVLSGLSSYADDPVNFVFFLADDISQEDFGCYGHPTIKTPNVDALAENGLRFDQAYLTTSSCSPSRCSIITGRYPHNTGAPELHTRLPDGQIRFPELLREAGYYTVLSGKNHMFGGGDRSFDRITGGGGPGSEEDWVSHVENRPTDKPFFFWFASSDAHRSWQISEVAPLYETKDVVVPPYLVDTEGTRSDLAKYYHEVSRFDHYIGLVRDALEKQGVLGRTMLVVAADNGRPFPRCKTRLYDSGIKTPWVVHFPEMVKAGGATSSLISAIDLSATCLELAGVAKPDVIQGQSFVPILKDPRATVRTLTFSEHNWHVYKNHERMVRFGDWLYIKNNFPDQPNLCYEAHSDPAGADLWSAHAEGKTTSAQHQIFANPCPGEEIFRVSKDGDQLINLAGNPEVEHALKKARKYLARWSEETGDTVPENPTPNRHAPPTIVDGKVVPPVKGNKVERRPKGELPGAARNAEAIHDAGPLHR